MPRSSKLRSSLSWIVENMAPASVLISLPDCVILSSNTGMIRRHGGKFAESQRVSLAGCDLKKGLSIGLRLERSEPLPRFARCALSSAPFEMMFVTHGTALIVERGHGLEAEPPPPGLPKALPSREPSRKREGFQPFHFSYMESVVTGRRTYAHPETLKSVGLSNGCPECSSKEWRGLVLPEDLPLYDNALSNLRQHGGNHELGYRIKNRFGETVQVSEYLALASAQDGKWPVVVGTVVSSGRSYEEMQAAERQLLQSRLVGGMVHDFKNLLGGIQNIIEWAVSLPDGNPDVREALEKTLTYTEQAASLISGALKLGSSKRESKIGRINLSAIALELESLVRRTLPASIRLELELEEPLPDIYAQRDSVKDMILNLCVNARDAMKDKGSLLSIQTFSASSPDERGRPQSFAGVRVKDDGCGMSKAELDSIFEAFYSTKDCGAGLGLWMVRETVRSFDGRVDVKSEPGEGSVFELRFPAVEDSAEEPLSDELASGAARAGRRSFSFKAPKTVLLVEDDPLIRESVSAWLESLGFELLSSGDGAEGLEMFKSDASRIDLVIQDYILPGIRGDELLASFLDLRPDIPVIVASANPDEERMASLKEHGAFAFLPKPFRMDELLSLLDRIFNGHGG